MIIVSNYKAVDNAILSMDTDRTTVCANINTIAEQFGSDYDLSFANGRDQKNENCPEKSVSNKFKIKLIDGLGDKIQSSSWLLKKNE